MSHATTLAPPPALLLRAARCMLRPLVALLIRAGLTFPVVAELLRGLYVEVAAGMAADERGRTDSRLSLLTGVHRKELRRLRLSPPEPEEVPEAVSVGSQVIGRWLGLPGYTDAAGQPRPLPRTAPAGEPSFDALVASVTRDIRPRTLLDEWLRTGTVVADAADRLRLDVGAHLPNEDAEARLFYFARNLHDHLAAAAANVSTAAPPFVERSLHYDRLPPEAAARLEAAARDAARAMLLDMNRLALALLAEGEAAPGTPTRRVNLGVYLFTEDEDVRAP